MNELFNEQYELIQQDLQEITNPYERAHIRALLLGTLAGLAEEPVGSELSGKDAIKNDIAKDVIDFEPDSNEEVTEEQEVEYAEEEMHAQSNEPNEIDLDKDPAINSNEPMMVETEENGTIDVREAYNLITTFEGSEEDKLALATNITLYSLTAIYEGLSQLKDCHNKMMLAYYMSEFGLEEINNFVSELTDGTFNDIYEFINDENLDGFIINVENAIEE